MRLMDEFNARVVPAIQDRVAAGKEMADVLRRQHHLHATYTSALVAHALDLEWRLEALQRAVDALCQQPDEERL